MKRLLLCLLPALFVLCAPAFGQLPSATSPNSQPAPAEIEPAPTDPLNRETPASSMRAFLEAAERFDWPLAANYLDLRNLPSEVSRMGGEELAEQFYFILSRRQVNISEDSVSDKPGGQIVDDLPDYRDELARVRTQDGDVKLLLQRVPGPEGLRIWKVSNATVADIPMLYEEFSYPAWIERIRAAFPYQHLILGFELYKWIILLIAATVLIPLALLLGYLLARLFSQPSAGTWPEIRRLFMGPLAGLAVLLCMNNLALELGVGYTAAKLMQANTLMTVLFVWLIWCLIDIWRARRRDRYEAEGRTDAAILGRPVANAIKLITLVVGLLFWLASAGVDISALLAGLGIGGIAVALALQKPIEDLFGAVSIYSQQPISTGDLCRYGDSVGRVEEIGLRTTRIRTLSNSVVSVPNATLASGIIENLTARTKIMYQPDLPLRYDTSRRQLTQTLRELEEMLHADARIEDETIRVRLREFSHNAIIVRIRAFALTQSIDSYLEIVQELNLEIMRIMDSNGVRFSQGAQTLFIKNSEEEANPFQDASR